MVGLGMVTWGLEAISAEGVTDFVIVVDAGLRFIIGSRQTIAPNNLATFFTWNGTNTEDGQLVDTVTSRVTVELHKIHRTLPRPEPMWSPTEHPQARRAGVAVPT